MGESIARPVELHIDCPDCPFEVTQTITEDTLREISQANTDEQIAECLPEIAAGIGVSSVVAVAKVIKRALDGYNTVEEAGDNIRDRLEDEGVRCEECGAEIAIEDSDAVDLTEED